MRIVLGTNVVVSGLLTPFGASAQIIRMVASGHLVLCYDVPDRDDEPFLEVAVAANIETPDEPVPLVTGNSKHYPEERAHGVKVVSPRFFVDHYRT